MIATSQFTISVVNDGAPGATGPQGVSVEKVVREYRLSDSSTEMTGSGDGYTWSETKPKIPSGKYLWERERTDLSNNTSEYGTAHCDVVTSGLVLDVDRNTNAITSKVWESDITTKINEYDGSTGKSIRDRVAKTETNISGINTTISEIQTDVAGKADGSTVTTLTTKVNTISDTVDGHTQTIESNTSRIDDAEDEIESTKTIASQTADKFTWLVKDGTSASNFTLTSRVAELISPEVVIKDPAGSATIISGGKIHANAITTAMLATDAIKSTNYTASSNASSPYSATGTYLNLTNGNFYTPNFGIDNVHGEAYLNGEIIATSGSIGSNATNYWEIGNVQDYNMTDSAVIRGHGTAYIQSGYWQLSNDKLNTQYYDSSQSSGVLTYYNNSGTYYDVGQKIPTNFAAYNVNDTPVVKWNKAWFYGRKYTGDSVPSFDSDWTYFFEVDSNGNVTTAGDIYEGGVKLSEKYAAITDIGSAYLPKTGGTITGNLTVNGAFSTNVMLQTNLASTSAGQLTGNANATVTHGVTGTLGVGNGGTGKSSWTANQIVYASASNTLSQLGSGTSGQILKSNGSSAPSWVNQSTLSVGSATKATQDGNGNVIVNTYMPIAGGQFAGAVYVPDEFSADSAQLGSLIVNGAARFTNDVFADTFTGNLVGTASNAVKVGNNLVIKLNGGSTEGTNLFTYNGSAAKTINITASSIGAQASGTYAGGISNGGAASKLAYQAGNEINFVSTADTPPDGIHINLRNGYTNSKSGTSSNIAYYFENYNGEYNHSTLYAAQLSGNAATATKLATARTITLSGSVTGSTTFDGSGNVTIATTTNHTHNYAGSSSAGGSANTVAGETGSVNADRHVWFSDSSTETKRNYDDDFKYNPSTNVLTVGSISGSAAYLTTGRTLTIGNTGKTFNGSSDVSWTKADISANATTSANGWMSSDDKTKLNGIQAGAQVNTITGVKGGSETDYRTGNVNITASNIGLGNVTNNKQVKGLASGTTSGHLVSWGSDGYTVADSGLTATSVATKITLAGSDYSASSNTITITQANLQSAVQSTGLLLMTSAERSKLASIQVSEGGTIDFSGVTASTPLTATVGTNKTVNITHNTSGVTAGTYRSVTVNTYGHVTAGTNPTTLSGYGITDAKIASGVITLGSNTITPLTASSTLDATKLSGTASISTTGNAATATKFASAQSVTLTGDTTGTASSQAGWSITTKTDRISTVGDNRSTATTPNDYKNKIMFQGLKGNGYIGSPSNDTYSYVVGLRGWSDSSGGKAHEFAFNDSGINHRSGSTTTWDAWEKLVTSANYTDYTVTKTGTGASGTWGISISGNAATASKANITTTTNAIAKYSDTQGTFANSNVYIDSDGNVVIGSTDSSGNVSGAGNFKIGAKNDSYGVMPYANNWNQIGSSSLYWYKGYINNYYGNASHVTNWDAGKNIGTAATASAAATRGSVYFYNTCAANGTQTKTLLDANASTSSNITITLPSSTGTLALTSSNITGNAATATKWASAQTVYVALGTASKTTSIQGGSSSAVTLGVDGVLGVANGGTGAASFTANSVIMSGSSTTGAFTTRAVTNNTSASAVTANTNIITANTLAYWTGSSNLTTCSKGTFGTMAVASASDYLKLSGGTMTGTIITTPNTLSMNFRNYNSYNTGFYYGTNGNEALTVALQNSVTSFMIKHGTDPSSYNSNTWNTGVPTLQAKKNSVYINELIPSGTDPTYKFKVNGISALKGGTDLFDSASDNTHANVSYDSTLQAIVFSFA